MSTAERSHETAKALHTSDFKDDSEGEGVISHPSHVQTDAVVVKKDTPNNEEGGDGRKPLKASIDDRTDGDQ